MSLYLNEFSKHYLQYRIILCLDKAGWHISEDCIIPENIKFWYLPPYSPELNPVEIIWRQIRQKYFNNRFFNTIDDVMDTLEKALLEIYLDTNSTKKLTCFEWLKS